MPTSGMVKQMSWIQTQSRFQTSQVDEFSMTSSMQTDGPSLKLQLSTIRATSTVKLAQQSSSHMLNNMPQNIFAFDFL